jgi:CheY-like chemotaxis protein
VDGVLDGSVGRLLAAIPFEGRTGLAAAPAVLLRIRFRNSIREQSFRMSTEPSDLASAVSTRRRGERKRILVIEDQGGLREILVQILDREGYLVDAAACLADARLALMIHSYDLLVLDLMLPDGSGYGLLTWLKADAACTLPRILVLSRLADVDDFLVGHGAGVDDYIGKPFEFDDLLHSISQLLA